MKRKREVKKKQQNPREGCRPTAADIRAALQQGVEALSIANVDLVCRDGHVKALVGFLQDPSRRTLQIFGMPGTGKTATVTYALSVVAEEARRSGSPSTSAVVINGYVVQKTTDIYWTLNKHLTQSRLGYADNSSPDQCAMLIERRFRHGWGRDLAMLPTCVIVMDEMDKIVEQHAKALFKVIDWLTFPHAKCKVITISNSMEVSTDAKVRSRLDRTEKLVFQTYGPQELRAILLKRISPIKPRLMSEHAINLVCQQTASHFGDVRRLLQATSSAVCGALLTHEGAGTGPAPVTDGLITIRDMHRVVRHVFHDRLVEFVKSIDTVAVFLTLAVIAQQTGTASGKFDSACQLDRVHMHVHSIVQEEPLHWAPQGAAPVPMSFAAFLEVVEQLREVSLVDVSIGEERIPVRSAVSLMEATEQPFAAMLHPSQVILDMCMLHERFGPQLVKSAAFASHRW